MLTLKSKQLLRDAAFNHVQLWLLSSPWKSEARAQNKSLHLKCGECDSQTERMLMEVLLKHNSLTVITSDTSFPVFH